MTGQLTMTQEPPSEGLLWRVVLDTGRLGDWVHVTAPTEQDAIKQLTRTQRRKVAYVRRAYKSSELRKD